MPLEPLESRLRVEVEGIDVWVHRQKDKGNRGTFSLGKGVMFTDGFPSRVWCKINGKD